MIRIRTQLSNRKKILFYVFLAIFTFSFITACSTDLPRFDGERAYTTLQQLVALGPRNPGSPGHQEALMFLTHELSEYADKVQKQAFRSPLTHLTDSLDLTNIIASFYVENGNRILLCTHWDTRPWADQDPNPDNRNKPIWGANDGASGVASLLELAKILRAQKPKYGVDLILFDGEDMGEAMTNDNPELDSGQKKNIENLPYGGYLLGSTYFAKHLGAYKPLYGILIDMVGDRNLEIYIEGNSNRLAPKEVLHVFEKAKGIPQFHPKVRHFVTDDHIPLNQAGIPTLLLIDMDYPYWHTLEDTPDKCSPESLKAVGDLLVRILYDKS